MDCVEVGLDQNEPSVWVQRTDPPLKIKTSLCVCFYMHVFLGLDDATRGSSD